MAKYYKEDCNQPDWPMFVSKIPLLAWINKPRGNPGSSSSIPPWDPTGSKNSSPLNLRSRRSKFSYTDWPILNDRSVEDAIILSGILVVWRTRQGQKVFVRVLLSASAAWRYFATGCGRTSQVKVPISPVYGCYQHYICRHWTATKTSWRSNAKNKLTVL